MIDIDKLTVGELREITRLAGRRAAPHVALPFKVGDAVLIRTVTMIDLGRVRAIGRDFLTLEEGGWVADTGRFSKMLETGDLSEFESAPDWILVGRGAICDAFPWRHALPRTTK
jgi:hypothetical protein